MKLNRILVAAVLGIALLALSACSVDIERNADGSLTATQNMKEADFSSEVARVLENDHISDVAADLHDGYITVSAKRTRDDKSTTDDIAFRVDLSNDNGKLAAKISSFTVNGQAAS